MRNMLSTKRNEKCLYFKYPRKTSDLHSQCEGPGFDPPPLHHNYQWVTANSLLRGSRDLIFCPKLGPPELSGYQKSQGKNASTRRRDGSGRRLASVIRVGESVEDPFVAWLHRRQKGSAQFKFCETTCMLDPTPSQNRPLGTPSPLCFVPFLHYWGCQSEDHIF